MRAAPRSFGPGGGAGGGVSDEAAAGETTGDGLDRESLEPDCEMEFFRAGGPGGQHRNKTETGVRLRHLPSGIVVTATERRSQARNRELAWERLIEELRKRRKKRKKRVKTRPTRASKERRLKEKKRRADVKQGRGKPGSD